MADPIKPGTRVRARMDHSGIHAGEEGQVIDRHDGTVFSVSYPSSGGVTYSPQIFLAPVDDASDPADHDGDNLADMDATPTPAGSPSTGPSIARPSPAAGRGWTSESWQKAMQRVLDAAT